MKCLIVSAHPLKDSLCAALTQHVVNTLEQADHQVMVEDLYAEGFKPALTVNERESYYTNKYDASRVASHVERLQEAEAVVLLFPTWWFGFPAILKGWIDRVWAPGIAYDHADDFGPIKPKLDSLRNVLVITTLGAPWWVDILVMRQPLKKIVRFALLGACAKNSRLKYLSLYKCEKLSAMKVIRFKEKIGKALNAWT